MIRPRNRNTDLAVFATLALCFLIPLAAYAQSVGATLQGTVTDASGASVPNAQITITHAATGITRGATTDSAGFYNAPNLPAGNYNVTASAPGFSTQAQTRVSLTVGAQQILNFSLQVGQVTQQVKVTAEAPTVQLATSSISSEVNSTTVLELPLNGRSWTDLANLQPGVSAITEVLPFTAGAGRGVRGFGAQVAISGTRPQQNNYRLDGVSIGDFSNGGPGSVLGGNLGVDAVQEFSVLTTNYSAEYGRTSGGVVNAITRSGSNQLHGDAYEFLRNSALDARNFFAVGGVPPFRRNQFGASAGAPIRKDRTFIFADYEGIRQSKGVTVDSVVPSQAARAGNLCSVPGTPPICTPTTVTVDPSAAKFFIFFPPPNAGLLPSGDTGLFSFTEGQVVTENFLTVKVDHKISERDSIFGTYLYDNNPFQQPDTLDNLDILNQTRRQIVVLEENHIFSPTLYNTFRFGFSRVREDANKGVQAINPAAADPSLAATPGQHAPLVFITGLARFNGGLGSYAYWAHGWNSFQGYDDASLTRGTHSLKFGFAVERMQHNFLSCQQCGGQFNFASLSDFLTNHPLSFNSALPGGISPRNVRETLFGAYLQDDWRWRRNVTLNLGLRYEMATVPTEVHGKLTSLLNITDQQPHLGSPFFSNPTLRNFEPRVGFAWDPFGDGKTAVRAGFGLFDVLPLPFEFFLTQVGAAPFIQLGTINNATTPLAGTFYTGAFPLLGPTSLGATYIQQKPPRNYVMQWNLNVQREISPNLTVMAGYVGNRGVHMLFRDDDANMVIPTLTPQGYAWPTPIGSGTVVNPHFGDIRNVVWSADSFYDGLVASVLKKMSHGVQIQGSFTWSKAVDDSSSTVAPDAFLNSISSWYWFNPKLTRAVSDFNIGRTLVINGIWQVPTPHSLSGPGAWLLGGWEIGGILKANDGTPFTPVLSGDVLGQNSGDPWDLPNRVKSPGCQSLINPGNIHNYLKLQCFAFPNPANVLGNDGRNPVNGPGFVNLDFSMFKNNYVRRISESFNVQFRAEFFNVLNHANFAPPIDNSTIFNPSGNLVGSAGVIDATQGDSREIQFALKLIW